MLILRQAARVLILFSIGAVAGIVLNILQMEHQANLLSLSFTRFIETTWLGWWMIPFCGLTGK